MRLMINIDEGKIQNKVTNNKFGLKVAETWWKLISPYTPKDRGLLMENVEFAPWEITYIQEYASYQYYGVLYIDPLYLKGAFYNPMYGFWSRPKEEVKKIPSDRLLQYQKNNLYSTDHWDIKAEQAGQKDKLYRSLNDDLQNGRI